MESRVPNDTNLNIISDITEDTIPWKEGRFLFALWASKCKDGKIPARSDFNPSEMTCILSSLVLLDIADDILGSKVRLMGTSVTEISKADHTGKYLHNVYPGDESIERLAWCIKNKKPYIEHNTASNWSALDYKKYNILKLPLAEDGENVNMTICLMTEYRPDTRLHPSKPNKRTYLMDKIA